MPSTTLNLGRVKGSMWYTGTADNNVDIFTALTSAGYTPIKFDMYINTRSGNVYQYSSVGDELQWTLKGNLRGAKGDVGPSGVKYEYELLLNLYNSIREAQVILKIYGYSDSPDAFDFESGSFVENIQRFAQTFCKSGGNGSGGSSSGAGQSLKVISIPVTTSTYHYTTTVGCVFGAFEMGIDNYKRATLSGYQYIEGMGYKAGTVITELVSKVFGPAEYSFEILNMRLNVRNRG